MNIKFKGQFKSITDFTWSEIPVFTIITGPNGSGKSQLLELIFNTITDNRNSKERAQIENFEILGEEVIYLKGEWNLINTSSFDLSILKQKLNTYYGQFKRMDLQRGQIDPHQLRLLSAFEKIQKKIGKQPNQVSESEFTQNFPEFLIEQEPELGQKIGEIFYNYRLSEIELQAKGTKVDNITEELGQKPWIVLKEIMQESKLPFKFSDPSNNGIRESFHFKLFNETTDAEINLHDLSSGEKVLISLVFYLYNSQEKKIFPKLLLLDEPDAHLHPTMAQQFLNVVKNVLVDKYGVRVIMTTHSPSTVVLSTDDSLFEMSKSSPRIQASRSKNHSISLLTSGLIFVGKGTKYVLVEDEDDVNFYSFMFTTLTNGGVIHGDIPLVFIPASSSTKNGGKTVVADWVEKLRNSGLEQIIKGLIDEDYGNQTIDGISKIDRYSIENYLLDPVITYAALIDKEQHFNIEGIKLKVGDEYKLKLLSNNDLQKIVDQIVGRLEVNIHNYFQNWNESEKQKIEITFTNGARLQYPEWIIKRRGKTLLNNLYHAVFGGSLINSKSLMKALKKVEFIPNDIPELFEKIQNNN